MLQMELLLCHKRTINKYLFVTFNNFFLASLDSGGKGDNATTKKPWKQKPRKKVIKIVKFKFSIYVEVSVRKSS